MTEELKTRSEVLKELIELKKAISPLLSSFEHVEIWGGDKIRVDYFTLAVVHEDGETVWYSDKIKFTPDPDTKIQALEKAQKLQMEECKTGCYPTIELLTSPENDKSWRVWMENAKSKDFPFADPTPESEFITGKCTSPAANAESEDGGE